MDPEIPHKSQTAATQVVRISSLYFVFWTCKGLPRQAELLLLDDKRRTVELTGTGSVLKAEGVFECKFPIQMWLVPPCQFPMSIFPHRKEELVIGTDSVNSIRKNAQTWQRLRMRKWEEVHRIKEIAINIAIRQRGCWKEEVKVDDIFLNDPQPGDLIIPIICIANSGKSTFINALLGKSVAVVGDGPYSTTADIRHYIYPNDHRLVYVLDIPGFDNAGVKDVEILRRIAVWLARSYEAGMRVAGVVYLHDLNAGRMAGVVRRNFEVFNKVCGEDARSNVIFVTTEWSYTNLEAGNANIRDLTKILWAEMLENGSQLRRFKNTQASAQGIIEEVLAKKAVEALHIQLELIEEGRYTAETEAGSVLRESLFPYVMHSHIQS